MPSRLCSTGYVVCPWRNLGPFVQFWPLPYAGCHDSALGGRPEPGSDALLVPLARGCDQRREGHPDPRERDRTAVLGPPGLLRRSRPAPEGCAHEPLRGGRQRRDRRGRARRERVPRRDAGAAHRREGPRPPGRAARRGPHRGPLPGAQAGAGLRHRDAGDLLAARRRGGLRGRNAAADRRPRPGHDRLPVRADPRPGALARAAARRRLLRERDRAHLRGRAGRHAQPARARHAAHRLPGGLRHRHRRPVARQHRRGLDVLGDLRADEALRRGRRGREGAPPPALRRGLRARDDPRRRRAAGLPHRPALRVRPPGEPGDDPPAQRAGRALRAARRGARRDRVRASIPRTT